MIKNIKIFVFILIFGNCLLFSNKLVYGQACINNCSQPGESCTGETDGVGCSRNVNCFWSNGVCTSTGGCYPYCKDGWKTSCADGEVQVESSTGNCHYPPNQPCNNSLTCVRCVADLPQCPAQDPACPNYCGYTGGFVIGIYDPSINDCKTINCAPIPGDCDLYDAQANTVCIGDTFASPNGCTCPGKMNCDPTPTPLPVEDCGPCDPTCGLTKFINRYGLRDPKSLKCYNDSNYVENNYGAECGSANGGVFSAIPTDPNALCESGYFVSDSPITGMIDETTYRWLCRGNCCLTVQGPSDICTATINNPPIVTNVQIINSSESVVTGDVIGVGRTANHICQPLLAGDRIVKFRVTVIDPDNQNQLQKVQLRVAGITFDSIVPAPGQTEFEFVHTFGENDPAIMTKIEVYAEDLTSNSGWMDSGHDFKVWNCQVPISGTFYDASAESFGPYCGEGNKSFETVIDKDKVGYSLVYRGGSPSVDYEMNVLSPDYNSINKNLIWGYSYTAEFNEDFPGSGKILKITNTTNNEATCLGSNLVVNLQSASQQVSPYTDNPALKADFSALMDQDPWFQVKGGGINAKGEIRDEVPITCAVDEPDLCQAAISVSDETVGENSNSLVIGQLINKGCENCQVGLPKNSKLERSRSDIGESYSYESLYDKVYGSLRLGKAYEGETKMSTIVSEVGGTGVVFVKGDLMVDVNNVAASQGKILMVVVSGGIFVEAGVDKLSGVLIADGEIRASSSSDKQLVIEGILYSSSASIILDRGFEDESNNNLTPAVLVKYRPDYLFALPGILTKILSGWRV